MTKHGTTEKVAGMIKERIDSSVVELIDLNAVKKITGFTETVSKIDWQAIE